MMSLSINISNTPIYTAGLFSSSNMGGGVELPSSCGTLRNPQNSMSKRTFRAATLLLNNVTVLLIHYYYFVLYEVSINYTHTHTYIYARHYAHQCTQQLVSYCKAPASVTILYLLKYYTKFVPWHKQQY